MFSWDDDGMGTATLLDTRRRQALDDFRRVRSASLAMCADLTAEEYRLQPIEDVSPPWWNLGHTSWFFVRNLLAPLGGELEPEDDAYDYLLNSYYESLGPRLPRNERGLVSRPTTEEIHDYRRSVDRRVELLIDSIDDDQLGQALDVLAIGMQHEQQHQELFYTEIKYIQAQNPPQLRRAYQPQPKPYSPTCQVPPLRFVNVAGGLLEFGHAGGGWCWDNELPRHPYFLPPFAIADRLVTCGEFLEFVDDGGYTNPLLWLDNGWSAVPEQKLARPLYWEHVDGQWSIWTLGGMMPLDHSQPVCHVSFYEADAFARWKSETDGRFAGARLPSEREWEQGAASLPLAEADDAFLDSGRLHPAAISRPSGQPQLAQMAGTLWQWTSSYYEPYPGYRPFPGVLAEYNGKFMDNQRVLRGGSCVTPRDHYRPTYRNFWPAPTRFQFTGIRLARDERD